MVDGSFFLVFTCAFKVLKICNWLADHWSFINRTIRTRDSHNRTTEKNSSKEIVTQSLLISPHVCFHTKTAISWHFCKKIIVFIKCFFWRNQKNRKKKTLRGKQTKQLVFCTVMYVCLSICKSISLFYVASTFFFSFCICVR